MSEEIMNTKEVAHYLGIHEKQVYALIGQKRIPATRVTGKWVFPRKLIDEWIESSARSGLEQARQKTRRIEGGLLASGSNDPILDMLQTHVRRVHPDFYLFSASTGSTEGLKALNQGYTDIAWSHLYDPESGEYNIPFLPIYAPEHQARGREPLLPGVGLSRGRPQPPGHQRLRGPGAQGRPLHQPAERVRHAES